MPGKKIRLIALVACIPLVAPIIGCSVVADLVNPAFLSALGFDPATVIPPRGTVVVAFVNDAQLAARFFAYALDEPGVLSGARNLIVDVEAGGVRFMALDCPIGAFSPGSVTDGTVSTIALITAGQGDTAPVQFDWQGSALIGGVDFQCGDVIEVAQTLEQGLGFLVTVVPGR